MEVGNIVRLKSGGPEMTVTSISVDRVNGDRVICKWFDMKSSVPSPSTGVWGQLPPPAPVYTAWGELHTGGFMVEELIILPK